MKKRDDKPVQFFHRVSKSTLCYGMAVPLESQDSWMGDIPREAHIPIKLRVNDIEIEADLTRLNNERSHLQIRYGKKSDEPFRESIRQMLDLADDTNNVVIKVQEIGHHQFRIVPFSGVAEQKPTLSVCSPVFHRFDGTDLAACEEFTDLSNAILSVGFEANLRQTDYNSIIRNRLAKQEWSAEQALIKEMGLRCDFQKNGVWVEIEFGNARTYYQDYIKFLVAAKYRKYRFGILLCPTAPFAGYLCELGRIHAQKKRTDGLQVTYSGMMTYEKAVRELPYMSHFLNAKIVIAGLEVKGAALS